MILPLVAVQNIVLKSSMAFNDLDMRLNSAPVRMFTKSLHSELVSVKDAMSAEDKNDCK